MLTVHFFIMFGVAYKAASANKQAFFQAFTREHLQNIFLQNIDDIYKSIKFSSSANIMLKKLSDLQSYAKSFFLKTTTKLIQKFIDIIITNCSRQKCMLMSVFLKNWHFWKLLFKQPKETFYAE